MLTRVLCWRPLLWSAVPLVVGLALPAFGLTITSGPSFTTTPNAPLAVNLQLTTDVPSRVSVSMSDGLRTWQHSFYDYATNHTLPLLGFKANRTNEISVTVYDKYRNSATAPDPLLFVSPYLPYGMPVGTLLKSEPDKMAPGYTLFRILNRNTNQGFIVIVDNMGEVVWYSPIATTSDIRQLANGDLFFPLSTSFQEIDMLGNTLKTWQVPNSLYINLHDGVPTPHGTILYLNDASRVEDNFPTSSTDPNAPLQTISVLYNRVVEISATNSALLNLWSPIDVLDPRRVTYLTFDLNTLSGLDIEHANAVIEDPSDNTVIVSFREQNAIVKFQRDTGALKWILGPPANWSAAFQPYLFTPNGDPFEWQYGQHSPNFTSLGTLMVYDDGNYRASPYDPPVANTNNYSRAVEYKLDETNMQITQVWDYGRTNAPDRIFTDRVGSAEYLPQRNTVLIDFGYIIDLNGAPPSAVAPGASMCRIQEVTHTDSPEVVFDLEFFNQDNTDSSYLGCFAYRAHRIPDLYSVQPQPVQEITLSTENGIPTLQFSADQSHSYMVEASTDLVHWQQLGPPATDDVGNFSFQDQSASDQPTRYYRVLTQ